MVEAKMSKCEAAKFLLKKKVEKILQINSESLHGYEEIEKHNCEKLDLIKLGKAKQVIEEFNQIFKNIPSKVSKFIG